MNTELTDVIPENIIGKPLDLEESVEKKTVEEAIEAYHNAYCKLLHPDKWKDFSGAAGSEFTLVKGGGNANLRLIEKNDFIKINLPGPGINQGDGFDWVKVVLAEENVAPGSDESFAIQLQACSNPQSNEGLDTAAHFFKDTATSTFIIKRDNVQVYAIYAGRNEVPNLKDLSLTDKLRNAAVSFAALAGLSTMQWSGFIKSLLVENDDK